LQHTMTVFCDPEAKRLHCFGTTKRMALDVYLKWDYPPEMTMCAMTARLGRGPIRELKYVRYTEMKNNPQAAQRLTRRLWRVLAPHLLPYILGDVQGEPRPTEVEL